MKPLTLLIMALSLSPLAACQSSGVAQTDDMRTIRLTSLQSRITIEIPQSNLATAEAPYALQGHPSQSPATPPGIGYQSR